MAHCGQEMGRAILRMLVVESTHVGGYSRVLMPSK